MGKRAALILTMACILTLAGCGDSDNAEKQVEVSPPALENENTILPTGAVPDNTDAGEAAGDKTAESDTASAALTAEQIEAAKQAALAYYEGTVFSVNSIEYFDGKLPYEDVAGSCNFTVNVSKGGVVQEPNRTITLQLDQGDWKVVNEGY